MSTNFYDPRRSFSLLTPPSVEPVTVAEAKNHIRLETATDDAYVTALVKTARRHVESETGRRLCEQKWLEAVPRFPAGDLPLRLTVRPLRSVERVVYLRASDEQETVLLAPRVSVSEEDPWVMPPINEFWPSDYALRDDAVRVEYIVGYASTVAGEGDPQKSVPEPLKQAMLLIVGALYENREIEIVGTNIAPIGFSLEALIAPYRIVRI